jgi:hypothetical protein
MTSNTFPRAFAITTAAAVALTLLACEQTVAPPTSADRAAASRAPAKPASAAASYTVYSSGFLFPRGLTFGNDGTLYVAEAGAGGTESTTGCAQVVPPVGPYTSGPTARISQVDLNGNRTTLASGFPSAVAAIGDVEGVSDVAFQGGKLYALVAGGGCSHGATTPASVVRVETNGSWSVVANLSAYQAANPVAQPFAGDYEPDGTWFSMIQSRSGLVAVEPNHGEIASIDPRTGAVERIADISATQGHIVPTAVAERRGAYYVGNLGTFPVVPGSSRILRVSLKGDVSVVATGFATILGLDFDHSGRLYVLEASPVAGFPTPNTGRITRIDKRGDRQVIVDGLFFPTAMRFGPDGALYVSNHGFGPPIPGEILRVQVPSIADDAGADMEQ